MHMLNKLDQESKSELERLQHIISVCTDSNPQSTIRFISDLLIDRAINLELVQDGLMEKIPIEIFAVSRSLQQRFGMVYQLLIDSSDEFCNEIENWDKDNIKEFSKLEDDTPNKLIAKAMIDNSDLRELIGSEQGKRWLTEHKLRKSASSFLNVQSSAGVYAFAPPDWLPSSSAGASFIQKAIENSDAIPPPMQYEFNSNDIAPL